jgi:hypothetical protein
MKGHETMKLERQASANFKKLLRVLNCIPFSASEQAYLKRQFKLKVGFLWILRREQWSLSVTELTRVYDGTLRQRKKKTANLRTNITHVALGSAAEL